MICLRIPAEPATARLGNHIPLPTQRRYERPCSASGRRWPRPTLKEPCRHPVRIHPNFPIICGCHPRRSDSRSAPPVTTLSAPLSFTPEISFLFTFPFSLLTFHFLLSTFPFPLPRILFDRSLIFSDKPFERRKEQIREESQARIITSS
jgi:hypothetical protein